MELASNYAVSIAPPSFQLGVEEAKRDNKLREQIPEPKPAQQSAAQSKVADERGGAASAGSAMAAQAQGMAESSRREIAQIGQDRRQNRSQSRSADQALNSADKGELSARPAAVQTAAAAQVRASTASAEAAGVPLSAASYSAAASSPAVSGAERTERTERVRPQYAKATAQAKGSVIAARYNGSFALDARGRNLDIAV